MASFGAESTWIALRSNDREAVRAALGLDSLSEVASADGLAKVMRWGARREVFVTPPIDDTWTLVVSSQLPSDSLFLLAQNASRTLGEARAFVCRGNARHFAWAWFSGGTAERVFERKKAKTLRDEGTRRRGEPAQEVGIEETSVLEVAASWSVDPSSKGFGESGFIGRLAASESAGPRWGDVIGGIVGTGAQILIEVAAILALGRLFGYTSLWGVAAFIGLAMIISSTFMRPGAKWKKLLLLCGVALALGAVLGGAFPHQPS